MKQKAFTLIELLVVISIIALLSSIVLASLNVARAKARYAQMSGQIRQIKLAADGYYSDNGVYPADVGIGVMPTGLSTYISSWPTPPCSGLAYDWNNSGGGTNVNVGIQAMPSTSGVYSYCIYGMNPTTCGTGAPDILSISSKQISCP